MPRRPASDVHELSICYFVLPSAVPGGDLRRSCGGALVTSDLRGPPLFGGHVDVVTLQAAVELKPREAEELSGARFVTVRALERFEDRFSLELLEIDGTSSRMCRPRLSRRSGVFRR